MNIRFVYNYDMENKDKIIAEMQLELNRLQSIISHYEENAEQYVNDYQDTVPMPRDLSIREKLEWCQAERSDGSKKLNRAFIDENGCINWTGRSRNGYGIIDAEGNKYRAHSLAKVVQEIPEITESKWKDNLNLLKEYKNRTQVEKLVGAHSCHNKKCINPDHITFKTNAENRMDSFYSATQTKCNETQQKLVYDFFLNLTDYFKIKEQLHEYTKTIGLSVALSWGANLVRGEKYITTPLGIEYKEKLAEKWLDINAKNPRTKFPNCLK